MYSTKTRQSPEAQQAPDCIWSVMKGPWALVLQNFVSLTLCKRVLPTSSAKSCPAVSIDQTYLEIRKTAPNAWPPLVEQGSAHSLLAKKFTLICTTPQRSLPCKITCPVILKNLLLRCLLERDPIRACIFTD